MKRSVKILSFIIAAVLFCGTLAGCTGKSGSAASEAPVQDGTENKVMTADVDSGKEQADPSTAGIEHNSLVVYFSYTGHLDSMAHWIADEAGGDIVRVTAKEAYPDDYDATVDRAKKEQDDDDRPEINVDLTPEGLKEYDTIFLGFPVWWYDLPMPMWTFLESYDFSGKTIIPFISHEGTSNGGSAYENIKKLAAGAEVRSEDALSIHGKKVDSSEQDVRSWVNALGYSK